MNIELQSKMITDIEIPSPDFKIKSDFKVLFMGSCFATNMYNKFSDLYLNGLLSPFGNIYNPLSLSNSIIRLINNTYIKEDELFKIDGIYQHVDFHSFMGNSCSLTMVKNINNEIEKFHKYIKEIDLLVLTLGTSFVYELEGVCVNNCHKLPKKNFNRRVLTVPEITNNLNNALSMLKEINPSVNIVITISPVRHLRDSGVESSLSKSILRVGIEELNKIINFYYFPSFELMIDELRDYRWYAEDLTHPSSIAIDYILGRFLEKTVDSELSAYISRVLKINKMVNHRVINSDSESYLTFKEDLRRKLVQLQKDYKHLIITNSAKLSQYL